MSSRTPSPSASAGPGAGSQLPSTGQPRRRPDPGGRDHRQGDEPPVEYAAASDDGSFTVVQAEQRGADGRLSYSVIGPDGTERRDIGRDVARIGDRHWTTDGPYEGAIVDPETFNAPYAESSTAVLKAAVTETTVDEVGVEDVRGVEATHYRITLDEAAVGRLERLRPNQLSAFELEYPANVRSLDVWIADDYIRRIRVTQDFEAPGNPGTTVEFYDFGADTTITPPR